MNKVLNNEATDRKIQIVLNTKFDQHASIIKENVLASDGIVHIIDSILGEKFH